MTAKFRIGQKVRDRRTGERYLYSGASSPGLCWVGSENGLRQIARKYLCAASGPNRPSPRRKRPKVVVTKKPGNRDWLLNVKWTKGSRRREYFAAYYAQRKVQQVA